MKRTIIFLLTILIAIFSLTSCKSKDEGSSVSGNVSIVEPLTPTVAATEPMDLSKLSKEDKVVYNKNNIEVTYTGQRFGINNKDEYYFTVKNNSNKKIVFAISSVSVNGASELARYEPKIVESNTTSEITIRTNITTRLYVGNEEEDVSCLQFVGFIVEKDGETDKLIEDNIDFEITEKNHSHSNDKLIVSGNLVYENEEVSVYVNSEPVEIYPYNRFAYSIINKTNKNIFITFDNGELRTMYMTQFTMPSTSMDVYDYIPANTFSTGTFYLSNTRGQDIKDMKLSIDAEEKTAMSTFTKLPITKKPLDCNDAQFEIKVVWPES
jgi:hypothetical protein